MVDEGPSKDVLVGGLTPDVSEDDLLLLFESTRYCPDGGSVAKVRLDRLNGTAVVTFEEPEVARKLIDRKCITLDNNQLTLMPLKPSPSNKPEADVRQNFSSSSLHEDEYDSNDSDSADSPNEINETNWWITDSVVQNSSAKCFIKRTGDGDNAACFIKHSDSKDIKKSGNNELVTSSPIHDTQSDSDDDDDAVSNASSTDHTTSRSSVVESDTGQDIVGSDDSADENQIAWEMLLGKSQQNDFKTKTSEKMSFPKEQLRLLHQVVVTKNVIFQCDLHVRMDEGVVKFTGSADSILQCKRHVCQLVAGFRSTAIDLSKAVVRLLSTRRGEHWLNDKFKTERLVAVMFSDKQFRPCVIALNISVLGNVLKLLQTSLTHKQSLKLERFHEKFLQSAVWSSTVERFESKMVSISLDRIGGEIVTEGSEHVTDACKELDQILNQKSKVHHKIQLKRGVFKVLILRREEIQLDVHRNCTLGEISFDEKANCIILTGVSDDVATADKYVRSKYIDAVCYDKLEVTLPGLTAADFHKPDSSEEMTIVALCSKHKSAIKVRDKEDTRSGPPKSSKEATPQKANSKILVECGSLAEFKADVLVNVITSNTPNLAKNGAISSCLLAAAGPQLQQDFGRHRVPFEFGTDVLSTPACGKLQARLVYHAAVRKHRNQRSEKLLCDMITKCLDMAISDKASSIAFPSVGCGRLGYSPSVVADCFVQAEKNTGTKLTIYIVAFEDSLARTFESCLSKSSKDHKTHSSSSHHSAASGGAFHCPVIVFHINAMDKTTVDTVKNALDKKVKELVDTVIINLDVPDGMIKSVKKDIKSYRSADVWIEFDKSGKSIILKGKKDKLQKTKDAVSRHLGKAEKSENDPRQVKKTKGLPAYLRLLGTTEAVQYPRYWKSVESGAVHTKLKAKKRVLDPKFPAYKEVEKLITGSWDSSLVGQGQDAVGLNHSRLVVTKIWTIENPKLFRAYDNKKKELCLNAAVNQFPRIKNLHNQEDVKTRKLGLKLLKTNLVSEINECYLLHGTKSCYVDAIVENGLDSRVGGDNGMFGQGVYFAESSTKTDQYADDKHNRVGKGKHLNMLVARVLLGNAFVCQKPEKFKKPPCTRPGCFSDVCTNASHGVFDSVIGTHKQNKIVGMLSYGAPVPLNFREFVVYLPGQSYPEFLIEYERR